MDNFNTELINQFLTYHFYDFAYSEISKENQDKIILHFKSDNKVLEKRNNERYKPGYRNKDRAFSVNWPESAEAPFLRFPEIKLNFHAQSEAFFEGVSYYKSKKFEYHIEKIDFVSGDHFDYMIRVEEISFSKLLEKARKCNELTISKLENLDKFFSIYDNMIIQTIHEQNKILEDELKQFFESKQAEIAEIINDKSKENLAKAGKILNEGRKIVFEWFQKYERSIVCDYTDDNVFYSISRYLEAGEKEEK